MSILAGYGTTNARGLKPVADRPATDEDIEQFKAAVLAKLTAAVGKDPPAATGRDWFFATALALRDRVIHRWLAAERESQAKGRKRIYYLSLEFLIGRLLNDIVGNLRLIEVVRRGLGDLGVDYDRMRLFEPDAALGNGGLGRLASCFMESMASLGLPRHSIEALAEPRRLQLCRDERRRRAPACRRADIAAERNSGQGQRDAGTDEDYNLHSLTLRADVPLPSCSHFVHHSGTRSRCKR